MKAFSTNLQSAQILCFVVTTILFIIPVFANAGPYTDSAHGNSSYGVKRLDLQQNVQGNCGHCHEQHTGTTNGLLLAPSFSGRNIPPYTVADTVCFQCHTSIGSTQTGGITNKNYSATFAGSSISTTSILDAFNQPSYHNLYDIDRFITGAVGSKSYTNFPEGSNPCSGCHNVHIAKANKRYPGAPTYTALSKPSAHGSLWGDDTPAERMTYYGNGYQPPNYVGGNLEPDGTSSVQSIQAEKTPFYDGLCIDCHNATNQIYSTALGRNLRTFNWSLEMHGEGAADDRASTTEMLLPYTDSNLGNYVLSCMDCHEPHGSPNAFLIRATVNAGTFALPPGSADWDLLCGNCHLAASSLKTFHHQTRDGLACEACHVSSDRSAGIQNCTNCHYHGSATADYKTF